MACKTCMRHWDDRPNDVCTNWLHWQSYCNYLELSIQDKAIIEGRRAIRHEREELINEFQKAKNDDERRSIMDQIVEIDGGACEHNRSWGSSCVACEELEDKLYGKSCDSCGVRPLFRAASLKNGNKCFLCIETEKNLK